MDQGSILPWDLLFSFFLSFLPLFSPFLFSPTFPFPFFPFSFFLLHPYVSYSFLQQFLSLSKCFSFPLPFLSMYLTLTFCKIKICGSHILSPFKAESCLLPARASEQGNVIGSVRIYYIYICVCVQKKIVIERTRDLNYLKLVATDFSLKRISPSAGENSGDLA